MERKISSSSKYPKPTKGIRCFLGIRLPDELKQEIAKLQFKLKSKYPELALTDADQLHITLFFLGSQSNREVSGAVGRMRKEIDMDGFELTLGELDYFYKKREDSVIYLNIEGEIEKIKNLREKMEECMVDLDYTPPKRWVAHLTIARLKRMGPDVKKSLLYRIKQEGFRIKGGFKVIEIGLWESLISFGGVHHRLMETMKLRGADREARVDSKVN